MCACIGRVLEPAIVGALTCFGPGVNVGKAAIIHYNQSLVSFFPYSVTLSIDERLLTDAPIRPLSKSRAACNVGIAIDAILVLSWLKCWFQVFSTFLTK